MKTILWLLLLALLLIVLSGCCFGNLCF